MAWDDIKGPTNVVPSATWNDMISDQKNRLKVFGMERYDGSPDGGTTTTGSISNGSDELIIASASTFDKLNYGILVVGAIADYSDTGNTDDTDQDFSTTGGDADREWMARKFTASASGIVGAITAKLGKTGSPAGTIRMSIYSDDAGSPSKPNAQIGGDSDTVDCDSLNSDAGGANQAFKWSSGFPQLAAGTTYWRVLKTTGYTYSDGVTEVRWRTDADGASSLNECAKYDADASPMWTSIGADVGANAVVDLCLVSAIASIEGTTLTLDDSATKTVSSAVVQHDEVNAITNAHTAATASGGVVFFPPGTYKVSSDLTINSNVTLGFASGGTLSVNDGVTITINGPIDAQAHQIFTGNGTTKLAMSSIPVEEARWWTVPGPPDLSFKGLIGGIRDVAKLSRQKMVTFVFDDGFESDYTIAKPLFAAQGEVACSAIITGSVGGGSYMSWSQIVALEDAGWEMLSHSKTHADLTGLSEAELREELGGSKDILESHGLTINNFVYPTHLQNATVRNITREYYRASRGGDQGINPGVIHSYALHSLLQDTGDLNAMKAYVDLANAGLWMIFYTHEISAGNEAYFNDLIDYIQSLSIPIVTMNEAMDAWENVIQTGDSWAGDGFNLNKGGDLKAREISAIGEVKIWRTALPLIWNCRLYHYYDGSLGLEPSHGAGSVVITNAAALRPEASRRIMDLGGSIAEWKDVYAVSIGSVYQDFTVFSARELFLKTDGVTRVTIAIDGTITLPGLTADWDIGDTRKLLTDQLRARDGAGLNLYDDDGNGITVADGGDVTMSDDLTVGGFIIPKELTKADIGNSETAVFDFTGGNTHGNYVRFFVDVFWSAGNYHFQAEQVATVDDGTDGGTNTMTVYLDESVGNFLVQTTDFVISRPSNGVIRLTYTGASTGDVHIYLHILDAVNITGVSVT